MNLTTTMTDINLSAIDFMYKTVGKMTDKEIISTYCSHFGDIIYKFPIYIFIICMILLFVHYRVDNEKYSYIKEYIFIIGVFLIMCLCAVMFVISVQQQPESIFYSLLGSN